MEFDPANASEQDLFKQLKTSLSGLSQKEAGRRLFIYGNNEIAEKEKSKILRAIFMEFTNPLHILLLVIATFSLFFGDKFSALIIYIMAAMSAVLSFVQEHRAENAVKKLNSLVRVTTSVIRDGKEIEVSTKELVPGDLVKLSAGDVISGDLRLISANDLFLSESSLSGESLPIEKTATAGARSEHKNSSLAFMGSSVVQRHGFGSGFSHRHIYRIWENCPKPFRKANQHRF